MPSQSGRCWPASPGGAPALLLSPQRERLAAGPRHECAGGAGHSFDAGTNGTSAPELYYRNSLHWDRRQFAALSSGVLSVLVPLYPPPGGMDLGSGLASLTANDYGKASLQHWLLGSDGVSISGSVSSQRDASPDAQGQTEGARTWYDYARKDPNNPQMEGGEALPGCIARVLPDGTTSYVCLDYGTGDSPFPLTHWESYTLTDGSLGVRTNWYHYSTNGVDLLALTNSAGQYVNLGYNTNHQVTSGYQRPGRSVPGRLRFGDTELDESQSARRSDGDPLLLRLGVPAHWQDQLPAAKHYHPAAEPDGSNYRLHQAACRAWSRPAARGCPL